VGGGHAIEAFVFDLSDEFVPLVEVQAMRRCEV
jgi:hypothetical protein